MMSDNVKFTYFHVYESVPFLTSFGIGFSRTHYWCRYVWRAQFFSDLQTHKRSWAIYFCCWVCANGKRAAGRAKMCTFKKLAQNPSKSGKRLKPQAIPSFWGDGGLIMVVSEFSFRHSKCHFWACKMDTFGKSTYFWV